MTTNTPLAQDYLNRFDKAVTSLPGHQSSAVAAVRQTGFNRFAELGFPNHRIEEWRFTNLSPLTKGIDAAEIDETAPLSPSKTFDASYLMCFVNGRFDADRSLFDKLPAGIHLTSFAKELESGNETVLGSFQKDHRAVVALNTAFMEDGFVLRVDEGIKLEDPILIRFVSKDGTEQNSRHFRNIVQLGEGAEITLLEEHVSETGHSYFANPLTDIILEEGARLNHYKLQSESHAAFHLANIDCILRDKAVYENFSLSLGARLSRNELTTTILGAGAVSILNGAYLMRGKQHCDTTTLTNHLVPENDSRQVYKGVLDGESRGIFQGKIHIAENAQKVAGDQLSKALLLSDRATVACKPELEIYADDVKCSHGATSGELDEDALFYLQSRGIDDKSARKILIDAFLADVIEEISDEAVRQYFSGMATNWLQQV